MRPFSVKNRLPKLDLGYSSSHNIADLLQHSIFAFNIRSCSMWSLNVSLPERIIDTNQAAQGNIDDSSYDIPGLQLSSRLCKSQQSSSSKKIDELTLFETSEAKKKRRKERSEKKRNKMENKSKKMRGIFVTQTTKRSDPHEYRRSMLSSFHGCALRTIEEVDEHCSIREEVKAVRVKMVELQRKRHMAVDNKASKVFIQVACLKAETDESRDQLTERHVLVEKMRAMRQQGSPGSFRRAICQQGSPILPGALKCGFLSERRDVKWDMSSSRSVASSSKSIVSSNRSVMSSSNADESVDAFNPFYL
jgi:hypothetical protein